MHNVLSRYLSTRAASCICFVLAVACKTWFLYLFMHYCSDRASLLLTTRNLLAGHGISIDQASLTDLAHRMYIHYNGWPPGYNVLLAPFLAIQPNHWMMAYLLVDLVTIIALFWYIRKLLLFIQVPVWLVNVFLLFQALLINDFMLSWEPTDFPALAALVAAVYYCLRITQSKQFSLFQATAAALAGLIAVSMRYQNVPVVLGVTGCLVAVAIIKKQAYKTTALTAGGITMAGILALWAFQAYYFNNSFFLPEADKGFYPENLQYTSYFVTSSFINVNFWATQLTLLTHIPYNSWIILTNFISAAGFAVLLWVMGSLVLRKKTGGTSPPAVFFLYGSIVTFITIGLLVWLSVTNGFVYLEPSVKWTYVMNERYFAFPILFIQVGVCWWLFVKKADHVSRFTKTLRVAVACVFLLAVSHGVYYLAKNVSKPIVSMENFMIQNETMHYLVRFIQQQQKEAPDVPVVVASKRKVYCYTANLYNALAFYDPQVFNSHIPRASKPVVLLAAIHKDEVHLFAAFLKQPGVRLLQTVQKYHFYSLYVTTAGAAH
jgi:hypothetical protein